MKKLFFFALTGVAAILAGCTKTETVEIPDSRAIDFSGAYIGNAVETRAQDNADITTANIDNFIVYGWYDETGDNTNTAFDGVTVTKVSDGNWTYTDPRYWIDGMTYNFAAYSPALPQGAAVQADPTNSAISFTGFVSNKENQNDLIFAQAKAPTVGDKVKFSFAHALSKVRFTFENGIGDVKLVIEEIAFHGVKSKGDYTYANDAMSWGTSASEPIAEEDAFTSADITLTSTKNTEVTADFLVIPQSVPGNEMTISFGITVYEPNDDTTPLIAKQTLSAKLPAYSDGWLPATCYNYTINIETSDVDDPVNPTLKPIEFTNPEVTTWHDKDQDINL